jgi:organic radical activating enzyme
MDIKLPFNGHVFWNEHYSFLNKSNQVKKVFVKIVLYNTSQFSDIKTARELIADIDPDIPTILQPVTAVRETVPPKQRQMLEWQDYFLESLKNVRIIPQTHVLQGQL